MSKAQKIRKARRRKNNSIIPLPNFRRYKTIKITEGLLKKLVASRPLGEILVENYPIDVETDRYESLYKHGWTCAKCR